MVSYSVCYPKPHTFLSIVESLGRKTYSLVPILTRLLFAVHLLTIVAIFLKICESTTGEYIRTIGLGGRVVEACLWRWTVMVDGEDGGRVK
jgi:hypothetical protein